jgi:hypothetical protein
MTLIETDVDKECNQELVQWSNYIENYNKPGSGDVAARKKVKPVFLTRNIRQNRSRKEIFKEQLDADKGEEEPSVDMEGLEGEDRTLEKESAVEDDSETRESKRQEKMNIALANYAV